MMLLYEECQTPPATKVLVGWKLLGQCLYICPTSMHNDNVQPSADCRNPPRLEPRWPWSRAVPFLAMGERRERPWYGRIDGCAAAAAKSDKEAVIPELPLLSPSVCEVPQTFEAAFRVGNLP